jgi:hypothetical protein
METVPEKLINYIRLLESSKLLIKIFHWNSLNLSQHRLLDELYDLVNKLEDSYVEELIGCDLMTIDYADIVPTTRVGINTKALILKLRMETINLIDAINDNDRYVGIKSLLESFIHDLNVKKYLFRMVQY